MQEVREGPALGRPPHGRTAPLEGRGEVSFAQARRLWNDKAAQRGVAGDMLNTWGGSAGKKQQAQTDRKAVTRKVILGPGRERD